MLRRVVEVLFVSAALLVAALILAGRHWPDTDTGLYRRVAKLLHRDADLGPVDFVNLMRRVTPNDALVCPEAICPHAKPDIIAPIFPVPAAELMDKLRIVVASEPRSGELYRAPDAPPLQARFAEYSPTFYFPDVIDAVVIPAGAKASTLALYSRSVVGYGDGGVNRARLERWVATLQRIIPNS
jgi:uncharacterized protein (DUF1499 family)